MSILSKSATRECTSCQMCAAVCARNAISIILDNNGFYRPFVDESLCIDCGLCERVCYKYENQISEYGKKQLDTTVLYGASAKQKNIIQSTTSGGIGDILAHQLVDDGFKCVGVVYNPMLGRPSDIVAKSADDINKFRGSKYVQSYTFDAFKEVVENCPNDKYAIFGTPCHIFALDKYFRLKNVRDRHILIDLYCHGCPSMNLWSKYVREIGEKTNLPENINVNFRSKICGWGNFNISFEVDGKPIFHSSKIHNDFFELYFSDLILNSACNNCALRGTLEFTDIRLGDFWGKQYVLNTVGVSAVSIVTPNAKQLFEKITNKINCKEEQYEDFLPWQSWGKPYIINKSLRNVLLEQLRDIKMPLHKSITIMRQGQSLKSRLTKCAKRIIHAMPLKSEKYVRWLFYKL